MRAASAIFGGVIVWDEDGQICVRLQNPWDSEARMSQADATELAKSIYWVIGEANRRAKKDEKK
ncbi:hypothetical protein U6G28_02455 [Actinomycetaceae bacterium MB13-C1-2]|nr:hypothetical protein U6G28_02455 [Actinomycetaceae bacterium MB13-C1-2]